MHAVSTSFRVNYAGLCGSSASGPIQMHSAIIPLYVVPSTREWNSKVKTTALYKGGYTGFQVSLWQGMCMTSSAYHIEP